MQDACTYRIINSRKTYFIYTDDTLLGSLQKRPWHRHSSVIKIKEHQYQVEMAGIINPTISVINITTDELIGKIKISNFGSLFPKATFEYKDRRLKWTVKSMFSLHWQWKKEDKVIIEAIEKFEVGERKGVIILSDYFVDADLLIMLGMYLRKNIKALSLNRFGIVK